MKNKTIILSVLALSVMALFSSFSFAGWGGAYSYMEGESSSLPISHALYLKEDGTVCVADFEGQSEDLLAQLKSNTSITKCSDKDTRQVATTYSQYFYNDNNSFKATKVALPAMLGGGIASAVVGCVMGHLGAKVQAENRITDNRIIGVDASDGVSDMEPRESMIAGGAAGIIGGFPVLGALESAAGILVEFSGLAVSGALGAFICGKTTYEYMGQGSDENHDN